VSGFTFYGFFWMLSPVRIIVSQVCFTKRITVMLPENLKEVVRVMTNIDENIRLGEQKVHPFGIVPDRAATKDACSLPL
jgi:hypothetical protein